MRRHLVGGVYVLEAKKDWRVGQSDSRRSLDVLVPYQEFDFGIIGETLLRGLLPSKLALCSFHVGHDTLALALSFDRRSVYYGHRFGRPAQLRW
jgi:hypothetical protein